MLVCFECLGASVSQDKKNQQVCTGALDVHEVGVRGLDKLLELVLALLVLGDRVQEIDIHLVEGVRFLTITGVYPSSFPCTKRSETNLIDVVKT